MGTAKNCLEFICSKLEAGDWIDLTGIVVNATIGIWIVKTIQNRLTNKRTLKDHFINELKDIRNEYKTCLNNLYTDQTIAKKVMPWFKLMNIKVADLMKHISIKYKIPKDFLNPYQNELRELITNNPEFISQFNSTVPIKFSDSSKVMLIKFQQDNTHLFQELIIQINDCD